MDYFLREYCFALFFGLDSWTLDVPICHKEAAIERVQGRTSQTRDALGPLPSNTCGVLFIRDKGIPTEAKFKKRVVIVRRQGEVTHLPDYAGQLVGVFPSDGGRHHWLVLLAREPAKSSPLGTGSTPAKGASPPPASSSEERPGGASSTEPPAKSPPPRGDALYQLDEDPQTSPPRQPEIRPRSEAQ